MNKGRIEQLKAIWEILFLFLIALLAAAGFAGCSILELLGILAAEVVIIVFGYWISFEDFKNRHGL